MQSDALRVALIQMDIVPGDPDANFRHAAVKIGEALSDETKPDVIVLPEMWNTGYALERIGGIADRNGERTRRTFSDMAKKAGVHIIAGSVADADSGRVRNTIYAFDREGRMHARYSKIHLFRLMDEHHYLSPGDEIGRLSIDGHAAGMMICYDIRFPELARNIALGGAKILFVPAQWPNPRLHHWRTLLMARAIENQMYVVACNRVGTSGTTAFFGHSMVVDPWGEIVAEAGEEETILTADIDLALVDEVRGRIPVFADRRPALYEG